METTTFFDIPKEDTLYEKVKGFVLDKIRNPDPSSEFERKTKYVRDRPDYELLTILQAIGYDVLLGYEDGEICGSFAFQKHEDSLHVFSMYTDGKYRGQPRVIMQLVEEFLKYARRKKVNRVRVGAGNNPSANKLINILAKREKELGIKVDQETCWIDLL